MPGSMAARRHNARLILPETSPLVRREHAQALALWRVMSAKTGIRDQALRADADPPGAVWNQLGQRMPVVDDLIQP